MAVAALAVLTACGGEADGAEGSGSGTADELRLGYFANVTHAAALIGVEEGLFADELGDTKLTTQVFNAGPDVVEALFAGALDASYIGPSPAINAYGQSDGDAVRIIAGATSGGAQLVVREGIDSPEDLDGHDARDPAARQHPGRRAAHLARPTQGLENSVEGGGDVTIAPHGQRRHPRPLPGRRRSTARGCRSRGRRGWCSRPARTCWSTRRTCGPTASS